MAVNSRLFGRTGWHVSEIGFGAWQLGGQWGPVNDRDSLRTLLEAYETGINFVDTAEMYGSGHSEMVVGRSLKEWRGGHILVATKVQPTRWPHPTEDVPDIRAAYPSAYLREQVEASLRRLAIDRIDLIQLHCWMPSGLEDLDWWEELARLKSEGKVDRIGVSLRDYRPDEGVALAQSGLVDSIQVIYNIFEQSPEVALFSAAASSGTAIIARVALDSGSLTGIWTPATYDAWPEGSVLREMFRGERFVETLERVEKVRAVVGPHYDSLGEAAIRFVLNRPEVSTVVIGMTSPDRVARNVSFADGCGLAAGLRDRMNDLQWRRNYYV